jgi:hypothetical protein
MRATNERASGITSTGSGKCQGVDQLDSSMQKTLRRRPPRSSRASKPPPPLIMAGGGDPAPSA